MRRANERTALLIRCTQQEADAIRAAARAERRTLSGFVLNALMERIPKQMLVKTSDKATQPRSFGSTRRK